MVKYIKTDDTHWFGVPVILALIALPVVMAFNSFPRTDPTTRIAPFVYAAPACSYKIERIAGQLVPVDNRGQRIGVFERYPDGVVQLTTSTGYAPAANECINRAGFGALIGAIRPYARPAT